MGKHGQRNWIRRSLISSWPHETTFFTFFPLDCICHGFKLCICWLGWTANLRVHFDVAVVRFHHHHNINFSRQLLCVTAFSRNEFDVSYSMTDGNCLFVADCVWCERKISLVSSQLCTTEPPDNSHSPLKWSKPPRTLFFTVITYTNLFPHNWSAFYNLISSDNWHILKTWNVTRGWPMAFWRACSSGSILKTGVLWQRNKLLQWTYYKSFHASCIHNKWWSLLLQSASMWILF